MQTRHRRRRIGPERSASPGPLPSAIIPCGCLSSKKLVGSELSQDNARLGVEIAGASSTLYKLDSSSA